MAAAASSADLGDFGLHVQLSAGSVAVSICAQLGHWLELRSRAAFCIAAAAQFVLEATPTALAAAHASAARSSQPPAQQLEAWADVPWHCANCTTALATVLAALPMSGEQHDVTAAKAAALPARPCCCLGCRISRTRCWHLTSSRSCGTRMVSITVCAWAPRLLFAVCVCFSCALPMRHTLPASSMPAYSQGS